MKNGVMKRLIRESKRVMAGILTAGILITLMPADVYADETSEQTTTTSESSTTTDGNTVKSTTTSQTTVSTINDDDRGYADEELLNYANSMKIRYTLTETQQKKLDDMFNSAVYYIAYTDMTKSELTAYVTSVKSQMEAVATTELTSTTSEYLQVADNWSTPTVSYGQKVSIVLPIINIGTEELKDLVIEPEVTADVKTWPFEPDSTGYIQTEPYIPGYINDDQAFQNRREFTYTFTVRDDVMTGFYELKFKISYTRAGVRVADDHATELSVYVQTIGKPESGYIGGNGNEEKVAKSRIIVTGYETNVDKVYSGDTFNLKIKVQNTSADTTVTNVLFNVQSKQESTSTTNTSESITPFIPTSGSNSIYVEKISPKEIIDLDIEMSAKPGLSQRSYALDVNVTYDSGMQFDLTDTASISIPVYQESKFDMSTPEISPADIKVGAQSDVMFSIYNTGKTTLYNVQAKFSADSIEDNMAFVGNLASGATGNVDVMLTGAAATMDDGTVNMVISYEDEAGNVTSVDKTISLYVTDASMDDMYMGDGYRELEEDTSDSDKSSTVIRVIAVVVILAVIIAGVLLFLRFSKKKREKKMLEEDLKDLDALDDVKTDENPGESGSSEA